MSSLVLLLAACSGGNHSETDKVTEDTVGSDTDGITADPLTLLTATVGAPASPLVFLARQLDVTTSRPARVSVALTDAAGVARTIAWDALAAEHHLPLLGLHAGSAHTAVVCAEADGERACSEPIAFVAGDLPADLPELDLLVSEPGRFTPGWTLLAPFAGPKAMLLVVDDAGAPVWAYELPRSWKAFGLTPAGTLFALQNTIAVEMDWLGQPIRRFAPLLEAIEPYDVPMDVSDPHHDVVPLPDGSIWTLSNEAKLVAGFPLDYDRTLTGDVSVADQEILHVGGDGAILARWSMLDRLDPTRIGWDALDPTQAGDVDWGHANAVVPGDDAVLVSLRHQDALVQLDAATGDVRWILANHDGWDPALQPLLLTPVGEPFLWPSHQHGPMVRSTGEILVFDNGNNGHTTPYATDGAVPSLSRIVQYTVDEAAMTVRQDWEWQPTIGGPLFSTALGNADWMAERGTVFATFSFLTREGGIANADIGRGTHSTRLIEFEPSTGETVWDLSIYSDASADKAGWQVDRAARVGHLYGSAATDTLSQ